MKRKLSQRELEEDLRAHFDSSRDPAEPLSLSHLLHALPAERRPIGRSGVVGRVLPLVALTAVIVLGASAVAVPLLLTHPGPGAGETAAAAESEVAEVESSHDGEALGYPSDDPAEPTPVDESASPAAGSGGGGDSGWWQAIKVNYTRQIRAAEEGWVEVSTSGPTQCEMKIYYSDGTIDDLGGFGAPSDEPRRRTIMAPGQYSGSATAKVTCWRDGPWAGPSHVWTLPITVAPAAPWTVEITVGDTHVGNDMMISIASDRIGDCSFKLTPSSGAALNASLSIYKDETTTRELRIPAGTATGEAHYGVTCTDWNGVTGSASGTVTILPGGTSPPEATAAPTEPPATEPPATEPPVTEPPATAPPATEPPAPTPETTPAP